MSRTRNNIYAFNDIIGVMNDDEVIMRRIVELAQIELEWKDVEPIYGKEATDILKDQTTPKMIQIINGIFERKPLISKGI